MRQAHTLNVLKAAPKIGSDIRIEERQVNPPAFPPFYYSRPSITKSLRPRNSMVRTGGPGRIQRQREDDGGVLLHADFGQRLQVAELDADRLGGQ